jgi:hypothetical protein
MDGVQALLAAEGSDARFEQLAKDLAVAVKKKGF